MKTWKKWLIAVFSVLLLAGIALGVVWMVDNWSAITSNTTLYTQEDLDNAYNQGLDDAGYDVIIQYQEQIAGLQTELQNKEITIGNLTDQLNDALENGGLKDEQIEDLMQNIADLQADITAKQEQIEELQDDIKYYEELLEAYADSDKLRVTFTMVDNGKERNYDVQVVEPNSYLSEVVTPDRADFEGWSLTKGGELIDDLTTIQVTENMTIYGMCTNTVTFMVNGEEYTTQEVSYNKYATDVEVTLTGYTLEGWSLTDGGEIVTVSTMPITADTTFYAVLENVDFSPITWDGLTDFLGMQIWTDGEDIYYSSGNNQYVLNKDTSVWEEKTWAGLTNFYGSSVWTDGTDVFYSNNNNQYTLDSDIDNWNTGLKWAGYPSYMNGVNIWTDGEYTFYSDGSVNYILFEIDTITPASKLWQQVKMNINLSGQDVWTDGTDVYYSSGNNQYVYDKETFTWSEKTWNGITNFDGRYVWTDGEKYYYSNGSEQYQLDKATSTWTEKTWTGLTSFTGQYIWTDGTNIYYSNGSEQYVLV